MADTDDFSINGFSIVENVYSERETDILLGKIYGGYKDKETFRKSQEVFAIRQFLKEIPSTIDTIFHEKLRSILSSLLGENYFVVKSIYFDKPSTSNWYVSYHQDLTISVDKRVAIDGFSRWTVKQNQFAVQPTLNILQNLVTVRIHLDNTDENNGALKVVPKSHLKGIYRPETADWAMETEVSCNLSKGGVMIMKPLLMHSSGRTTNNKQRRVIHIEFSNQELPAGLHWSERINVNAKDRY